MDVSQRVSLWVGAGMLLAAVMAAAMVPNNSAPTPMPDLEALIPKQFGDWQAIETGLLQIAVEPRREDGESILNQPYDQTVMRTYRNSKNEQVMLAIAYGREQRQEVKIHRPELCYASQGFKVLSRKETLLPYGDGAIPAVRLITSNGRRLEPVTYWVRMGDSFVTDAWQSRLHILKEGLLGRIPDGILVRVSNAAPMTVQTLHTDFHLQQEFLADFLDSVDASSGLFTGTLESLVPGAARFPLLQRS